VKKKRADTHTGKEKERRASLEAFAVPWLKAAEAESFVCADGRL
jgi:hypothetical protein